MLLSLLNKEEDINVKGAYICNYDLDEMKKNISDLLPEPLQWEKPNGTVFIKDACAKECDQMFNVKSNINCVLKLC